MTHTHARMHVILQSMLAAKSFSPERTEEGVAGYIAILAFEIATRACGRQCPRWYRVSVVSPGKACCADILRVCCTATGVKNDQEEYNRRPQSLTLSVRGRVGGAKTAPMPPSRKRKYGSCCGALPRTMLQPHRRSPWFDGVRCQANI